MKRTKDVEKLIRDADMNTRPEMDAKVLDEVLRAHRESQAGVSHVALWQAIVSSRLSRMAAAAVMLIGVGYLAGRLAAPQPPDMKQLMASVQSSLEPSIRAALTADLDRRLESSLAAYQARLENELRRQVRLELAGFAVRTLDACETLTNQSLMELVQLIEAARARDRWRVASALEQIRVSRLEDRTQFRNSLQRLAAGANEPAPTEHN